MQKFSPHLGKCVGHSWKILGIIEKTWLLSENSSPPLVPQAAHGPGSTTLDALESVAPLRRNSAG